MSKAWVIVDQQGSSLPVFARTKNEALNVLLGSDEDKYTCTPLNNEPKVRRAKQYDRYAGEGRVPVAVLLQDGWEIPCRWCGRTVSRRDLELGAWVKDEEAVYCQFCADRAFEWQELGPVARD